MPDPKTIDGRPVTDEDWWTWVHPRSDEEVAQERADTLAHLRRHGQVAAAERAERAGFTCDACGRVKVCVLSFDPYNTGGDCLWDK